MSDGVEGDDVRRGGGRPGQAPESDTTDPIETGPIETGPIGAMAGAELAIQLRQAWVNAGRPPMATVGDLVGYSKATISKVLSGKMPPAWHLVRKLGAALGITAETVTQTWHPLWIAADEYRRAGPYPVTGAECDSCGAWVVNRAQHDTWHEWMETQALEINVAHQWATLRDSLPTRRDKYRGK